MGRHQELNPRMMDSQQRIGNLKMAWFPGD